MANKVRTGLIWLTLASAVATMLAIAWLALSIAKAVHAMPKLIDSRLQSESDLTRKAVREMVESEAARLDQRIASIQQDLVVSVRDVLTAADKTTDRTETQVKLTREAAEEQLRQANQSLASVSKEVSDFNARLTPLIENANRISARLAETSDTLLDCKGHGACLPAQTLALIGSARYTMGQIARSSPEVTQATVEGVQATRDIAKSAASLAKSWEKKTPVWVKILGYIGKPAYYVLSAVR